MSGPQAVYKSNPGTVIVCRKRGTSGQERIQHIKYLHCQFHKHISEVEFGSYASSLELFSNFPMRQRAISVLFPDFRLEAGKPLSSGRVCSSHGAHKRLCESAENVLGVLLFSSMRQVKLSVNQQNPKAYQNGWFSKWHSQRALRDVTLPRGESSRPRLPPHCLAVTFNSRLPSPKVSLEMPPKLPLPTRKVLFPLSNLPPQ